MTIALLDVRRAARYARDFNENDPEVADLLKEISERKTALDPEMGRFADLCDRFDDLYYPPDVLQHAGASHWASHPSATTPGRSHISLNSPPSYVDIPASLQSVPPIENMVSMLPDPDSRLVASMVERLYFAWKDEEEWDLKTHQACVVKGLYGRTAAKVYWDENEGRPCVSIVDQPRNLYLGWGTSDYRRLDWAMYTYRQSAEGVYEDWGLMVASEQDGEGQPIPYVIPRTRMDSVFTTTAQSRPWQGELGLEVEVYDYWYRKPRETEPVRISRGKVDDKYRGVKFDTWNAIFVGNELVKNAKHPEYDGKIPYIPLFNTYVPGLPDGRPELYDIESLLREKDERLTDAAQMLSKTVNGQVFQLTGQDAPDVVPNHIKMKANSIQAPGAGNRIEKIEPWMPEFQVEQYLNRLDRELADVSGLNELLRGLAPSTVLSSSKAITALVANYEVRVRLKRDLLYQWRRRVWEMTATIWADKAEDLAEALEGAARLQQTPPSLTPRDDIETANLASNLVSSKLWSQKRGMDRVGVDDPETESDIIRTESTDATLFPERVQVMAQLMTVFQSLGLGQPPGAEEQAAQQAQSLADFRGMMGGQTGTPMLNDPAEQSQLPPEALPENAGGMVPGGEIRAQTMVQEGEAQGRLMTDIPLTGTPPPEA